MSHYEHTQRGRLHHVLWIIAAIVLIGAWLAHELILTLIIVGLLLLFSFMFGSLTVCDDGDWLLLRYGPLPVFRKRIRYADITAVEPDETKLIDGWGIHYVLGRGWTYNLWGFGCVKLTLGTKIIRIGTDDVDQLADFLRQKIPSRMNANQHE